MNNIDFIIIAFGGIVGFFGFFILSSILSSIRHKKQVRDRYKGSNWGIKDNSLIPAGDSLTASEFNQVPKEVKK